MPMGSTRMGDHSIVEVDAEVKNTVKSQERRNGASNKCSWGDLLEALTSAPHLSLISAPAPSPAIFCHLKL